MDKRKNPKKSDDVVSIALPAQAVETLISSAGGQLNTGSSFMEGMSEITGAAMGRNDVFLCPKSVHRMSLRIQAS